MITMGIVDPVKVVRTALAGRGLGRVAADHHRSDDRRDCPRTLRPAMPGGGGMGGMGGMDF